FSYGKGRISHVGIYVGNGRFVHAANSGVQYDHLNEAFWAESYIGTRRPNQF
ncbi:MAG: C40 family peptidase, partial [Bacteroidota bacterium]